jgi:hypothetical protein
MIIDEEQSWKLRYLTEGEIELLSLIKKCNV